MYTIDESCGAFILNRLRMGSGQIMQQQEGDAEKAATCLALFQERLLGSN